MLLCLLLAEDAVVVLKGMPVCQQLCVSTLCNKRSQLGNVCYMVPLLAWDGGVYQVLQVLRMVAAHSHILNAHWWLGAVCCSMFPLLCCLHGCPPRHMQEYLRICRCNSVYLVPQQLRQCAAASNSRAGKQVHARSAMQW